ncbi:Protein btn-like protein [Hapsidospora chrysogenum ATCC 11550]|uniref:Protein BTN n=1 Tax=Hapsidospora chrysogenum (strain ATCC 11550 / CBS 779.69 / DSM 880 / IAM 14645 / JCM 23072 / IMI 49137) TaxID=857340 RepID=A0A086TDV3_HAPC1|nr:Protein btn-like protein [Hapsidospora chrysogenum ATCC 11550]
MAVNMHDESTATAGRLRTVLGYALVGFVNTILPSLVFSSAYLIVPYPRSIVLLIHTLPALLARLPIAHLAWGRNPHASRPHWNTPLAVASAFAVGAFIIYACPPNVTPVLRILGVALASAGAAAGEVLWLGMLGAYGKPGLAGWGLGTGIGGVVCAVLPYVLTVYMGRFLRTGLGYAWYLVPLMLVAHYLVLPQPTLAGTRGDDGDMSKAGIELDVEASGHHSLLMHPEPASSVGSVHANLDLAKRLARPFMLPLGLAMFGQSAVVPGFSRAMTVTSEFGTYTTFLAAYGLAFQLGNLIARSSVLVTKPPRARAMLAMLAASVCLLAWTGISPVLAEPTLVFTLAFVAGLGVGATYMATYVAAVEGKSESNRGLRLGVIGAGEPIGLVLGGLASVAMDAVLCSSELDGNDRWCHTTR